MTPEEQKAVIDSVHDAMRSLPFDMIPEEQKAVIDSVHDAMRSLSFEEQARVAIELHAARIERLEKMMYEFRMDTTQWINFILSRLGFYDLPLEEQKKLFEQFKASQGKGGGV